MALAKSSMDRTLHLASSITPQIATLSPRRSDTADKIPKRPIFVSIAPWEASTMESNGVGAEEARMETDRPSS